jgi:uncharacterized membrane protein
MGAIAGGRWIARVLLALFYGYAGIAHLRSPESFMAITPVWVPEPYFVIIATGLCEIAGAVAILTGRLRWIAGVMLALYALCVYPANVRHALEGIAIGGKAVGWWYHGPRLALQPVIIWWALYAGAVIDWPFARRTARVAPPQA